MFYLSLWTITLGIAIGICTLSWAPAWIGIVSGATLVCISQYIVSKLTDRLQQQERQSPPFSPQA